MHQPPTPELSKVLAQSTGASFLRADLHIHSYGGSHDVTDATLTPAAIIATAETEGLRLIAVTDHNEISNVGAAISASQGTNVLVVPGVELSTSDGHILCYFPTSDALTSFYGKLTIVDRGTATSRCQQSLLDCLNLAEQNGGFCILAHVDAGAGYETEVPGASPHKLDVLCHRALLGIELKNASSQIYYSALDPDQIRAGIGAERVKRLGLEPKQSLARVLNSDAHTLTALGRNAQKLRRVTRYKVDAPTFPALRVALEDADARVRIEDLIPEAVPRVLGVYLDGGFLTGQAVQFSPNLNCIIGGRGTGKSTTFEAVRCLDATPSDNAIVDSEVWPDELFLFWQDRAGQVHSLYKAKGQQVANTSDPNGPISFDIDCFGQGEAARISIEAQTNPLALLQYLDRFVDLSAACSAEEALRSKLLELQNKIEEAEQKVEQIPQLDRLLNTTQQQLAALQKPEVKDLIALQRTLATEREVRNGLVATVREAKATATQGSLRSVPAELRGVAKTDGVAVGIAEVTQILVEIDQLDSALTSGEEQVQQALVSFEKSLAAQFSGWTTKEAEAQKKIEAKRKELEALKVSFDMSYISKLAQDEARHAQTLKSLNSWKPYLADVRKQRATVLKQRWEARERIATLRDTMGRKASDTLKSALNDLQVSLKYSRNALSPDAQAIIIGAMGWKTNQQIRANHIVERLTIPALLTAMSKGDLSALTSLKTPEGVAIFKADEAQSIFERLNEPAIRFSLERVSIHDLPRLQVARQVKQQDGSTKHVQREFSKLSLGQQQSVLLALMLASDTDRPLIIDQPEDNLDGEFIYKTLVPVLRQAKERRQVIIVTHNPNVAVLGDAELLVVMRAVNDRAAITSRGSIDNGDTQRAACSILEGAREAFVRRGKTYGMSIQDLQ